jgi:hypothetical protein
MKKQRESGGYEPANFLKPKTFSLTEEEEEEEFGD